MARLVCSSLIASAALLAAGCVESFGGSNLQIDFSAPTPVAGGNDPDGSRAPADTYFIFYAVEHVFADDGVTIDQSFLYEVNRFEIQPVVNTSSPCFIDLEDALYPGLHVTQFAEEVRQEICTRLGDDPDCFEDPLDPPIGATEGDITDILGADRRVELLSALQGQVKAVTTTSNFEYPDPETGCDATGTQIPAITCGSVVANQQRLAACRALWESAGDLDGDDVPDFYEGSDTVFTLPLSGQLRGMVEGPNPKNGGFVGGSTMVVEAVLEDFDAFTIHWQFKDHDDDGEPDYPDDFFDDLDGDGEPDHQESAIGYPFMTGEPEQRVREVINAKLTSNFDSAVYAEVAIFPSLSDDDVHF